MVHRQDHQVGGGRGEVAAAAQARVTVLYSQVAPRQLAEQHHHGHTRMRPQPSAATTASAVHKGSQAASRQHAAALIPVCRHMCCILGCVPCIVLCYAVLCAGTAPCASPPLVSSW